MKTEKIVYTPEVIYQPNETKHQKSQNTNVLNNKINQKAALIAATLLAMSAAGESQVNIDTNKSANSSRDRVILLMPQKSNDKRTLDISETDNIKEKKNDLVTLGLLFSLTGFSLTLASLLNMNELLKIKNKNISLLTNENEKLRKQNEDLQVKLQQTKEAYNDFREAHPGLGVMSAKRTERLRQDVLGIDFLNGENDGRN